MKKITEEMLELKTNFPPLQPKYLLKLKTPFTLGLKFVLMLDVLNFSEKRNP